MKGGLRAGFHYRVKKGYKVVEMSLKRLRLPVANFRSWFRSWTCRRLQDEGDRHGLGERLREFGGRFYIACGAKTSHISTLTSHLRMLHLDFYGQNLDRFSHCYGNLRLLTR
jgi:hypothetical protein